MIEIVTEINEEEWKRFLDNCNTASIYHTPEWKKFLEETFNYKPHYLFAKDECGEIAGLLPLFHVKSKLTGNRLCSAPFAHDCSPVGNEDILRELIGRGIDLFKDLNLDYFEIRDSVVFDGFCHQNAFSTYILGLSGVEPTWDLINKSIRRYIKKSMKQVTISKSSNIEDAEFFYQINCKNKKEKGVPAHPKKFIYNLVDMLPGGTTIYLAKVKNEIIGGIITLSLGKDRVLYGYGATDPRYVNYHPLHVCLWKSIEEACLGGNKYYDFGRVSYDNTGLINFKQKWGGIEKKLYYSYYPKDPESLTEDRNNLKYQIGTKVLRSMPMPVYKKFSDMMFGHFG